MQPIIRIPAMLEDLKSFFTRRLTPSEGHHGDRVSDEVRYAAAALMLVCAKSDFVDHPEEERAIVRLLESVFDLDQPAIDELVAVTDTETVVQGIERLTGLVNRHYTLEDKQILIENLWHVAFADGRLDEFEEQYIARVAFMIDLSQAEVARRKAYVDEAIRQLPR